MDPSDPSKVRHRHVTGVDESDLFYHHQTQPKQPELEGAADKKLGVLKERVERASLTWYLSPLMTGKFFLLESYIILGNVTSRIWTQKKLMVAIFCLSTFTFFICLIDGPHQSAVSAVERRCLWYGYWLLLGVLSSVGLGTGLHTFLLYLGPFIAKVTMAAYECDSINFPEPPYPNEMVCPEDAGNGQGSVSVWKILSKVRLEAVLWGVGTAFGELPPYFLARASRLTGKQLDDEQFAEMEELLSESKEHAVHLGLTGRVKVAVHEMVDSVGFLAILLCASIPNPFFDLAGMTCGYGLVPFSTFFSATMIGKAVVKMHIQKVFVIFLFSAHHVDSVIDMMSNVPRLGVPLQTVFRDWLEKQRSALHQKSHSPPHSRMGDNILGLVTSLVVFLMVAYFVGSIVNSLAQNYHKRLCHTRRCLQEAGVDGHTGIVTGDTVTQDTT